MKIQYLILLLVTIFPNFTTAQSSPEELARMLVYAVNNDDTTAVRQLFHPLTTSYYQNLSEDALQKQINILLKKDFTNDYSVNVTPIEKVEAFDLEENAYKFLGIKLKFIKRPNLMLDINETEWNEQGVSQRVSLKEKGISEMIIKEKGRWYIIRPENPTHKIKVKQKN